jgi:hypothetical protein
MEPEKMDGVLEESSDFVIRINACVGRQLQGDGSTANGGLP